MSQFVLHKLCDTCDRSLCLPHDAHIHGPVMPDVRPHLDRRVTASGAHLSSYPQRVISADEDKCRGKAGRIAVKRRCIWDARVGASEVKIDDAWRQFDWYHRVDGAVEPKRSPVSTRSVQGETTTATAGSSIPSSRNRSMVAGCVRAVLSCPTCDRYRGRGPFPEVALLAPRNRPDANVAIRALRQDQRSSFPKLFPAVGRLCVKRVRW